MTTNSTQPPRGTRDFLPPAVRRREYVIGIVRETYERYGFEPLETPAFENIETLTGKYGEEGNKLIFKILKRGEQEAGGADLALRYDLTVPLARVVAQYQNELPRFFKRYQIQPVWRADRPARGRFREFYQCDVDAVGSTSPVVEVELLGAVGDVLARLGFDDFRIRLNHRRLLSGILSEAGIAEGQHGDALIELDKRGKVSDAALVEALIAKGLDPGSVETLLSLVVGGHAALPQAVISRLNAATGNALAEIETLQALSRETPAHGRVEIDLSLARGLSYYTGAIMEIAVEGIGSLGGGGRYDNLVGMFLGRDVPACGFSLGLERIIVVMTERNMFPVSVADGAVDVVVAFMDDDSRAAALGLASALRARAIGVDIYPETARKFDKPLRYASGRGAKVMGIFGENERAKGEASIRNLLTREQVSVPLADAVPAIAALLKG